MKLLHICRVFCQPGIEASIAVTVHIVVVVDRVLYSILGDGVQKRASLFSLVSEEKSIVAASKVYSNCLREGAMMAIMSHGSCFAVQVVTSAAMSKSLMLGESFCDVAAASWSISSCV